jgi:hypothetical protein
VDHEVEARLIRTGGVAMTEREARICVYCQKPLGDGEDGTEFTSGEWAHDECSNDIMDAEDALADFDENGGVSLDLIKAEIASSGSEG